MKKIILFCLFVYSAIANAEIIKESKSGICHEPSSPHYKRTKNFTSFESLASCINDGGRLAKGSSSTPASTQKNNQVIHEKCSDMVGQTATKIAKTQEWKH